MGAGSVLAPVAENVDERIANLARSSEPTSVIAVRPDRTPPTQHAVDGLRHSYRQSLNTVHQARMGVSLDQEMYVVDLNAEVKESESSVRGGAQGGANGFEDVAPAK